MNKNYTDKELEKLFQEGLNNPDIMFREDAWSSMEILLNEKNRRKRLIFFWLFFGGIAISSLVIGRGLITKSNNSLEIQSQENKIIVEDTPNPAINQSILNGTGQGEVEDMKTESPTSKIRYPDKEIVINEVLNDTNSEYNSKRKDIESIGDAVIEEEDTSHDQKAAIIPQIEDNEIQPIEEKTVIIEDRSISIEYLQGRGHSPIPYHSQWMENLDGPTKIISIDNSPGTNWKIGFFVGPEWSSTPSSAYGNMDWSIDFTVTRMIGSKLGVYTGIGYISDSYQAGKYDYRPERGFWTRSIAPERTNARCRILDFPIGFQYYLSGQQNSGLVLSVGIMSQFMVREAYYYKYENEEPDLVKNWMGSGENFHLLSGIQFSVLYRIRIGKGMAMGINPYFNLPTKGIGHGHIKISSLGLRTGIDF